MAVWFLLSDASRYSNTAEHNEKKHEKVRQVGKLSPRGSPSRVQTVKAETKLGNDVFPQPRIKWLWTRRLVQTGAVKCSGCDGEAVSWLSDAWRVSGLNKVIKMLIKKQVVKRDNYGNVFNWLTIMFSKAHLASQQLRNTGMKMPLIEGQKIWGKNSRDI